MSAITSTGIAVSGLLVGLTCWFYKFRQGARATAASVLAKYGSALSNKRVLVTGACGGLGFELARAILEQCEVAALLVHGRSEKRVQEAIASLPAMAHGVCKPAVADLARLKEVDALAKAIMENPPDVLVCCAGVATLPQWTATADGYEMQFGSNHLAHFHLVSALIPYLKEHVRVVMVSSDLQHIGRKHLSVDLDSINDKSAYSWFGNYLASKYCNVLFAKGLAQRGVHAVSCSPGAVATNIDRYLSPLMRFCFRYLGPGLFSKSPEQGAATLAFCVAAPTVSGEFYAECKSQTLDGPDLVADLWQKSEDLVNAALKA